MLSKHTLNPKAQPFYLKPTQQQHQLLYFSQPICYYIPPSTFGFFPSFHAPTSNRSSHSAKTDRGKSKVCATGDWRCHHKFYKWRVRGEKILESGKVISFPNTFKEAETSSITTVMIRNVPNQFKFDDLLHILDEHCLRQNKSVADPEDWSKFDFVYLPMDWKHVTRSRMSNLGYAFVNFTSPEAAFRFYREFQGLKWDFVRSKKICEINVAQYQGKDNLMRIFQPKVFRCASRDFLPVLFSEGRHGFNRGIKGTYVGNHVWGLPRRTIGNCAFDQKDV
ncbi:hypothetical protein PHAVU_008G167000 [Phaseolus vulgaris]|uniref:Mei2-like C-terminal RNA recognition motif domain-containing protein n=1 Tax=Phaseolus vulgaris TaxID=3885 RepID=V7B5I3_PHAVU|nr:hypothetical protein PHAVU_008G167000g [Phaseolus vulgaris]ESW13089.1 hypothetical protein PHAVU_008G167000g [Phaseolus vulgaris]